MVQINIDHQAGISYVNFRLDQFDLDEQLHGITMSTYLSEISKSIDRTKVILMLDSVVFALKYQS